jgi:flagellar hook-basal body complex protein FliE
MSQIIGSVNENAKAASLDSFMPFEDLLKEAVSIVKETDAASQIDMLNASLGDADALHDITINAAKADLAIQTLVAVRNKALDAYNEIMRITL